MSFGESIYTEKRRGAAHEHLRYLAAGRRFHRDGLPRHQRQRPRQRAHAAEGAARHRGKRLYAQCLCARSGVEYDAHRRPALRGQLRPVSGTGGLQPGTGAALKRLRLSALLHGLRAGNQGKISGSSAEQARGRTDLCRLPVHRKRARGQRVHPPGSAAGSLCAAGRLFGRAESLRYPVRRTRRDAFRRRAINGQRL